MPMTVGHEAIECHAGARIQITVSRDAYVLAASDDEYRRYLEYEALLSTFAVLVQPPIGTLIPYCAGRAHVLVWPVEDREPEWLEDFSFGVMITD
ncbi:MAG TPA: hypothetical protein VKT77_21635 [Chthonomonadaceae bacterium]|nr:hypothetical protein [Chthonomonadaceae bacterium]